MIKKVTSKINKPSGFTLIELLVTIAIIAVLSAVLIANMVGIRERGADTKTKNDLNQLKTALRLYYNDFQSYPTTDGTCVARLGGGDSTFNNGTTIYMKELPADCQFDSISSESFVVSAPLKNGEDPSAGESATKCGIGSPVAGHFYVCSD